MSLDYLTPNSAVIILNIRSQANGTRNTINKIVRRKESVPRIELTPLLISLKNIIEQHKTEIMTIRSGCEE